MGTLVRPPMKHPPKSATPAERRQVDRTHPAIVLLRADRDLDAPIGPLSVLLAQALATSFGDAVLVIHLAPAAHFADESRFGAHFGPPSLSPSTSTAGPPSRTPSIETDGGRVSRLRLPLPAEAWRAASLLRDKLRQLVPLFAYIFVDASARGEADLQAALLAELGSDELSGTVRRLVHLTRNGSAAPGPGPAPWSTLITYVLGPLPEHIAPPSLRVQRPGIGGQLDLAKRLAKRLRERLGGEAIEPRGEPYPEARVVPEWCRVRLDLLALAAQREPDLARLPEGMRRSIGRWARALTWRRVGVALGGSGAWGYAHVALMRSLEERGVPIDLIGGSSSGAVMGAFYSVLGAHGLDLAIARGPRFDRLVWLSTLTSTVIDLGAGADLGATLLEDLEVTFLPVATNLTFGRPEIITRSTVASAVRASASAPGIFASTITRAGLYVDGAISDNVPVVLVERMGADMLVACNPLPPPPRVSVRETKSPLGDFLAELNPINRLRDLRVSFELMIHDFGDCEPAETRVLYDPPPEANGLLRTFDFARAHDLVREVEREEGFRQTIERAVETWRKLAAPRLPA
jgi:NTE family protein